LRPVRAGARGIGVDGYDRSTVRAFERYGIPRFGAPTRLSAISQNSHWCYPPGCRIGQCFPLAPDANFTNGSNGLEPDGALKAEIICKLHEITDYYLLGPGTIGPLTGRVCQLSSKRSAIWVWMRTCPTAPLVPLDLPSSGRSCSSICLWHL
jgi:hypothetical protein